MILSQAHVGGKQHTDARVRESESIEHNNAVHEYFQLIRTCYFRFICQHLLHTSYVINHNSQCFLMSVLFDSRRLSY